MCRPNLQSVALAVPEIIAIAVFGWAGGVANPHTPVLGKGRPYGVYRSKELF